MIQYNHKKIEKKWQKIWKDSEIYKIKDEVKNKKNFYHLVMFPYPSGDLHIGHWYNFAPADVYARLKMMQGFNVMSPIGFDAFGLPAENAAIKRKIHPKTWTYKNIKTMKTQLDTMGNIYDWSREIITSDPEYYKWTQWMFLQMYKNGLAYKKKAPANWCPKCHTVLANEQVVDGKCERCETEVIRKDIDQWLFKITKYADRLLKDIETVNWPEKTKIMQKNWIGKSEGTLIKFQIPNSKFQIEVFTTRIDTIYGCTYCVIAPEHEIINNLKLKIKNFEEVNKYIEQAKKKSELQRTELEKEKTGVELKGINAINSANNQEVPIFVADYVLGHYGTGAIMAVPAHDERDAEFAQKFNLPVSNAPLVDVEKGIAATGAKRVIQYHLRDWLVSRQRYWGAPIPIIYCDKCGEVAVPEKDLPILLPSVKNYLPTEEGKSPLGHSKSFVNTKCPKCGNQSKRETDTMDTFVCSSWYFLRYVDPKNNKEPFNKLRARNWLPVNMYIGGAEHTVLHLLYSRFFTKALKDFGYLDFSEPFINLKHQGIILGPDGQKMSKSRGNVIDPDELVKNFGTDAVRMYLCFMAEYSQGGSWNPTGILGVKRFLERIYKIKSKLQITNDKQSSNDKIQNLIHKTIKKVTEDIENFKFNTAVSSLMILVNEFEKENKLSTNSYQVLVKLLAPFVPHLAEELWEKLGNKKSIFLSTWPQFDTKKIKDENIKLIIQINGKIRDILDIPSDISKQEAERLTLERENVKKWIGSKTVKKTIFVPNKLINLVI